MRIALLLLIPFIAMAQGPTGLGIEHPGITVTHTVEEIPPGALYLGTDLSFEQVPNLDWYGLDDDLRAFKSFTNPLKPGLFHLRQQRDHSIVYQVIDTSSCSPLHPLWATFNVSIESTMHPNSDIQQGIIFDGLTGLSIATLFTRWNNEGLPEGAYDEIRVRVEGLDTDLIWLAIGADFGFHGPGQYTKFDTDKLTIACLPIGWVPLSKIYLPVVLR